MIQNISIKIQGGFAVRNPICMHEIPLNKTNHGYDENTEKATAKGNK